MEERTICKSLQELQTHGGVTGVSEHALGIPGNHKLRSSLRFHHGYSPNKLGYNNPAFSASTSHITGVGAGLGMGVYHYSAQQCVKR